MNMSTLITRIKRRIGIYGIDIPVDVNKLFTEVIEDTTIPVFSMYEPDYQYLYVSTDNLQQIHMGMQTEEYLLPDSQYRKIVCVADVSYDSESGYNNYPGLNMTGLYQYNPFASSTMHQNIMLANVQSQIYGKSFPSLRFDFRPPRTIVFYNKILSNTLRIQIGYEHDKSLTSISPTLSESFFELALLDCTDAAYQIAKHWDTIETSIGSIKLNIDDWSNAAEQRKALLEDWTDRYHLDFPVAEITG